MSRSKNSKRGMSDEDLALALELHEQCNSVGITENAVFPEHKNKENYQPRSLIDQTLEIIDPTPNIHTLFMQFNARFFGNKLLSVEVKWSARMTSCAGVCSFHPRSRDCVISLSAPLLKLRPRKDLVETLLHEMIHGYLFLTNNNRDRDGHGPEFCKHMNRINQEAGTHISIYHSFHDEVKLYQQHWWRCNGPCQNKHPYFGMVRRAMNRPPGPSDFWFKTHQQNCGGQFIKVKEPDKTKEKSKPKKTIDEKKKSTVPSTAKNSKNFGDFFANGKKNSIPPSTTKNNMNLNDFFAKPKKENSNTAMPLKNSVSSMDVGNNDPFGRFDNSGRTVSSIVSKAVPAGLVKLGTSTNNVHGFGTGGPGSAAQKTPNASKNNFPATTTNPKRALNFTGTVGGASTGRSNLLDKFSSTAKTSHTDRPPKKSVSTIISDAPAAKKPKISLPAKNLLDDRPLKKSVSTIITDSRLSSTIIDVSDDEASCDCPVCGKSMAHTRLNDHLDVCLADGRNGEKNANPTARFSEDAKNSSIIEINSSPETPGQSRGPGKSRISAKKGQTNLDGYVTSPKKTVGNDVSCPVCGESVEIDRLNAHLDDCLSSQDGDENVAAKRPSKRTKISNFVDPNDEKSVSENYYVCLVCNARINGDIALTDHLDECVQAIFNDDSIDVEYNDSLKSSPSSSSPENSTRDEKFPCPICMQPIHERNMNEHLDACLSGEKWD